MTSSHKRNDARYDVEDPNWTSLEAALTEIRQATLFGRESVLKKLKEQSIAYDADDCPGQQQQDADVVLECLKQIEQICFFLIERQVNDSQSKQRGQLLQLRSLSRFNEQNLLISYRGMNVLSESLAALSKAISRVVVDGDIAKAYQNTHDSLCSVASTLQNYKSGNPDFNQEKDYWATQNSALLESIGQVVFESRTIIEENSQHNSQESKSGEQLAPRTQQASEKTISVAERTKIDQMQDEIAELEQVLRQNNEEFTQQVQKYNHLLYEQQLELKEREQALREAEGRLVQLETANKRLRQLRMKDELVLENMSRKQQLLEKERGYLSTLSPRLARNVSPNSTVRYRLDNVYNGSGTDKFQERWHYKYGRLATFQHQYQH